jgi:hypothetical protein
MSAPSQGDSCEEATVGRSPSSSRTLLGSGANGVVAGQTRSTDGQSVAGIRISAMVVPEPNVPQSSATTTLVSFVLTDADGRYRLENVLSGRYYTMAGLVDLPTYYPGVSGLSGARVVSVASGATVSGIDFPIVVPVGVSVKGLVIRSAGQPVSATATFTSRRRCWWRHTFLPAS